MISNMLKRHQSKILTLVAIAVVVYLLTTLNNTSDYSINEREYVGFGSGSVFSPLGISFFCGGTTTAPLVQP